MLHPAHPQNSIVLEMPKGRLDLGSMSPLTPMTPRAYFKHRGWWLPNQSGVKLYYEPMFQRVRSEPFTHGIETEVNYCRAYWWFKYCLQINYGATAFRDVRFLHTLNLYNTHIWDFFDHYATHRVPTPASDQLPYTKDRAA